MYSSQSIHAIIGGEIRGENIDDLQFLVFDSRRIVDGPASIFFALQSPNSDGHGFVKDAYAKGVRCFVLKQRVDLPSNAAQMVVTHPLEAMQQLAAHHRQRFSYPVIGITGSNGKTVIKEWLNSILQTRFSVVRSPRSYNSQIGVPLSVWQMNDQHNVALIEAGISTTGEMDTLEMIIRPTIGIISNLGEAHSAGFHSKEEKLQEKLKLFKRAEVVIGRSELLQSIETTKRWDWSSRSGSRFVVSITKQSSKSILAIKSDDADLSFHVPFDDDASIENSIHCILASLYLGLDESSIQSGLSQLHPIDMRLQLKRGINDCLIINDSYSSDLTSLKIALDFMRQHSGSRKRTVILSQLEQTGMDGKELMEKLAQLLRRYSVNRLIWIGNEVPEIELKGDTSLQFYSSTESLLTQFQSSSFNNEVVLIKGSRRYELERAARMFELRVHQTVMHINLDNLAHNLKEYKRILPPQTGIMAMVKAFAYGSGGVEVATVLQENGVRYLGVAYGDEGVELVRGGIRIPIMVMNVEPSSFQSIIDHNLEPVLYSLSVMEQFEAYLRSQGLKKYPVHLEIETGMNRLGFLQEEIEALGQYLQDDTFQVRSVFSHLVASEDPANDEFTKQQAQKLTETIHSLKSIIQYPFLHHISNSAAAIRHPQLAMDLVRLGIGMYGVEFREQWSVRLIPVATLRSTIAQLHTLKKGETVSYNRKGVVERDSIIATVRIGYADGYSRRFSNGVGKMGLRNKIAPVIGNVCMDMTMIDVTDIAGVEVGDEVEIFGEHLRVDEVAASIGTISYELLSGISQRVKRVYYHEQN